MSVPPVNDDEELILPTVGRTDKSPTFSAPRGSVYSSNSKSVAHKI